MAGCADENIASSLFMTNTKELMFLHSFSTLQNFVLIFKSFSGPKHLRSMTLPPVTDG